MKRIIGLGALFALASLIWVNSLPAQEEENAGDSVAVAKGVLSAKVPLDRGFAASAAEGQPISAKFEIEDGRLHLSVYTAKGGKFYEVTIDPNTSKVAKVKPITEGGDLSDAQSQNTAMAGAKMSLAAALTRAESANVGYRAVSITPSLAGGAPVAEIKLVKAGEFKTVTQALN